MASLHKLPVLVILISSVICFFSSCSINVDEDPLKQACTSTSNEQLCMEILKNDKLITAAAKKELDLGLAIMKSIIAQTKTTHDYVLKKKPENHAYDHCEVEWLDMVPKFERILETTTKNKGYKDDTDDYDFHAVGDAIGRCVTSLKENNIEDPEIIKRGDVVTILMSAANNPLTHLRLKKKGLIK